MIQFVCNDCNDAQPINGKLTENAIDLLVNYEKKTEQTNAAIEIKLINTTKTNQPIE